MKVKSMSVEPLTFCQILHGRTSMGKLILDLHFFFLSMPALLKPADHIYPHLSSLVISRLYGLGYFSC